MFHPLGSWLAHYLNRPVGATTMVSTSDLKSLQAALQPGDVLLIEGNTRISVAIKYLTQSTWSHAALYVGSYASLPAWGDEPAVLIEADLDAGVRAVPLSHYAMAHTRICRPVGLTDDDRRRVIEYVVGRLGHRYDLRNVIDLVRYLLPTLPVPTRWRRRMFALGSGDPTRAICSTLIAQAFQSVRYPILPTITRAKLDDPACADCYREYLHIRHHSLFTPRDFDISPFFEIVKPALAQGFNYRTLAWADTSGDSGKL